VGREARQEKKVQHGRRICGTMLFVSEKAMKKCGMIKEAE
jgi:hypothetical protein